MSDEQLSDDWWFGLRSCDGTKQEIGNKKLKRGRDDRERARGTGLPSVCWLSLAGRRTEKQKEKATQR